MAGPNLDIHRVHVLLDVALLALLNEIDIDLVLDLCIAFILKVIHITLRQVTGFLLFAVVPC